MRYIIRPATIADAQGIYDLYKKVSAGNDGLARSSDEISTDYIAGFTEKAAKRGIQLVAEDEATNDIIAEIHCYKMEPKVFSHVLGELTIAVHPDAQGYGLGKAIFGTLLSMVEQQYPDILRIELIARESNSRAIMFYQKLGFVIEGRFEKRISSAAFGLEADIPMAWMNKNYKG